MPQNNRRAGGRAPKNFDPSYARGGRGAGAAKPGSRSAGHRGFRPESADASAKKPRWSADERVSRGHREDRRGAGFEARTERPARDDRAPRGDRFERSRDGAPRRFDRDDRAPRRDFGDRAERPARSFDRDDRAARPARSFDGADRPARSHDRDGRAPRPFGSRGERPARSFDRSDRPDRSARSFDRADRPARSFDRDERPARSFDRADRPARAFDRSDRADRPARSFDRDDRAPRRDVGDRAERPARSFDRDDRGPRRGFGDRADRPERTARPGADRSGRRFDDDRPRRSFDRDDRGPRREFGDRPARSFDRGARPERRDSKFFGGEGKQATAHDDQVLERLQAEATQASDVEGVTFADLGLGQGIVRALDGMGASAPFPIQAATIPDVLAGKDVLGRGRTGSGKTIAFGAPTAERLVRAGSAEIHEGKRTKREFGRAPRALILAPTRELALQIDRTVQPIARSVGLFTTQVYGGVPQRSQVIALERGVDIVIGTPGRIEDLLEQGRLDLSQVMVTVLDEADHMCDLGFLEPVQRILRETAEGGQKLLFSATLDSGVASLVDEFLVEPAVHEVAGEDQASGTIEHRVFVIDHRDKIEVIRELADRDGKTLIFSRTRSYAEELAEGLDAAGIPAVSLHGDLNQSRRTRNLEKLTNGRVNVLVATDVAARGIHVDDIDLVIQADAPDEYKTYLHRSGRTGRAGKRGTVVTLASRGRTRKVEGLLDRAEINAEWIEVRPGDVTIADVANGAGAEESAE